MSVATLFPPTLSLIPGRPTVHIPDWMTLNLDDDNAAKYLLDTLKEALSDGRECLEFRLSIMGEVSIVRGDAWTEDTDNYNGYYLVIPAGRLMQDERKIDAIKLLRRMAFRLGLKEAKELIEQNEYVMVGNVSAFVVKALVSAAYCEYSIDLYVAPGSMPPHSSCAIIAP